MVDTSSKEFCRREQRASDPEALSRGAELVCVPKRGLMPGVAKKRMLVTDLAADPDMVGDEMHHTSASIQFQDEALLGGEVRGGDHLA